MKPESSQSRIFYGPLDDAAGRLMQMSHYCGALSINLGLSLNPKRFFLVRSRLIDADRSGARAAYH